MCVWMWRRMHAHFYIDLNNCKISQVTPWNMVQFGLCLGCVRIFDSVFFFVSSFFFHHSNSCVDCGDGSTNTWGPFGNFLLSRLGYISPLSEYKIWNVANVWHTYKHACHINRVCIIVWALFGRKTHQVEKKERRRMKIPNKRKKENELNHM